MMKTTMTTPERQRKWPAMRQQHMTSPMTAASSPQRSLPMDIPCAQKDARASSISMGHMFSPRAQYAEDIAMSPVQTQSPSPPTLRKQQRHERGGKIREPMPVRAARSLSAQLNAKRKSPSMFDSSREKCYIREITGGVSAIMIKTPPSSPPLPHNMDLTWTRNNIIKNNYISPQNHALPLRIKQLRTSSYAGDHEVHPSQLAHRMIARDGQWPHSL